MHVPLRLGEPPCDNRNTNLCLSFLFGSMRLFPFGLHVCLFFLSFLQINHPLMPPNHLSFVQVIGVFMYYCH